MREALLRFIDPRFVIALMILGLQSYMYWRNPGNETVQGSIMTAFATAVGFWLGSSRNERGENATANTTKALDAINSALASNPAPSPDVPTGAPGDPVHVQEERPS